MFYIRMQVGSKEILIIMNKICTSIEQSQKLIELGIDVSTADMYYEPSPGFCTEPSEIRFGDIEYAHPRSIRSWSLVALLKLMPTKDKSNEYYVTTESHSDYHQVNYVNCWDGDIHETDSDDCLIDAAFEMICWLKENEKI